jgi:predicted MFS family arabinose efflux permease
VNLLVARVASVAADNSPSWAQVLFTTWRAPLTIAVAAGVIGVLGAAVYWVLETRAQSAYTLGRAGHADKLVFADLFKFTPSYWLIVGLCLVFYSAVFPFRTFAIKFFMEGHGATRELGGFLNSVLPMSAMVATPLFGLLVDRVGRRALFMMVGSALLVPAFVLLVPGLRLTPTLYVPIALLGIAFSLVPAIMWPSVTYVVEENRLGTAYALMTLVQQLGVLAMNWAIGAANDGAGASQANPAGYAPGMWLFSLLGFLGVVFAVLLRRRETSAGGHGLETITTRVAAPGL